MIDAPGRLIRSLALGAALWLGGCSSPTEPLYFGAADTAVQGEDTGGFTAPDVATRPDTMDATPGAGNEVAGGSFCGGAPPACAGAAATGGLTFNCACTGNADCASGLCIQTPGGKVCTADCIECCPDGFSCAILAGSCPDCQQACLPAALHLCRPCNSNAECENPYAPGGERCVDSGDAGRFCGTACSDIKGCSAGYSCKSVTSVDGATVKQCVPDSGACECSKFATEQGAQTACSLTNEAGSCPGTRVCTPGGLGACEGRTPMAEECDGKDNDCDGLFDEGTCPGGLSCACSDAGCACGCPPGQFDCGSGCIDPKTSVAHCGDCNAPCVGDHASAFLCQDGNCTVAKCEAGFEDVDSLASTGCECQVEAEVCDGKDNDCDGEVDEGSDLCSGEGGCTGTCMDGTCACSTACEGCGGTCVPQSNFGKDPQNCGYCGNACALLGTAIHSCEQGECCAAVCKTGFKDCNKDCKDGCEWLVESEKCDGIDNDCNGQTDEQPLSDCGGGKVCLTGVCQCDPTNPNLTQCGSDICIDLSSNADNCGFCGNDCDGLGLANAAVTKCTNKECAVAVCKAPWVDVDGESWNGCECQKTSAAELCDGADNNCNGLVDELPLADCAGAKICTSGSCTCDPSIDGLAQCAGDGCVDLNSDPNHCGFCGNDCDGLGLSNVALTNCIGKTCGVALCTTPWVDVDGKSFNGCECQKTATIETCDGVDNNCDGVIDTFTEPCSTLCGTGIRSCAAGQWSACDARAPITCKDYTTCQDKPVCLDACPAPPPEVCNGFDENCNGKIDEGFLCSPGDSSTQACGNCGSQPVKCNAQCQYDVAGACTPGGICTPGAADTASCGLCGTQSRTCSAQCGWSSFGQCQNEGVCAPGFTDTTSCGKCGKQTRPCASSCQWGSYGACTGEGVCATGETSTQPCGLCGVQTRSCSGTCGWGQYGACQSEGVCSPGQVETAPCGNCGTRTRVCGSGCQWGGWTGCGGEGVCAPNAQDAAGCGNCGSKVRTCTSQCQWGGYGACSGEGVCSPSASEAQGCGNCGTQSRTCSSQCQWSAYGACGGQGVCAPGTGSSQGCGNCGSQSRTCTSQCQWGTFGTCGGQGVCAPGDSTSQACGSCGSQSRSCSGSCQWETFGTCGGQGVCTPSQTRSCSGACGTQTCSGACGWGGCSYSTDSREPNDTYATATNMGSYEEGNGIPVVSNAWLHSAADVDRYYYYCTESGSIFDTSMGMSNVLSGVGGWHHLCVYFDRHCDGGVDATSCTSGTGTLSVDTGDIDSNDGSDDDGCVDVEVYGDGSCAAYTLQFKCD